MANVALALTAPPGRGRSVAELVLEQARRAPDRVALVIAAEGGDRKVAFGALSVRIQSYMAGLRAAGLPAGARVMVLAHLDEEVLALLLAVLAGGMTLVLVDGRLTAPRLLAALGDARPHLVVAPPALLRWWPLVGPLRRARRASVGGRVLGAGRMEALALARGGAAPARDLGDVAAIVSFTSASTGRAKAVVRTHAVLSAQHGALASAFPIDGGANLPGFPSGTLHNLCCGVTTILPPDFRTLAETDPAAVVARIRRHEVTSVSGAPAFLRRLAAYIRVADAPQMDVRRLVVGGGPVGRALCAELRAAFPRAVSHVVYGATEAEPIAAAALDEVAAAGGGGFLVGRPVAGTELRLVAADGRDAALGEVVVRGAHVVGGGAWHRTGDVGRMDADGRLWLLGRVGGMVGRDHPVWPYVAESAALSVDGVRAASLVSHVRAPNGELLIVSDDAGRTDDVLCAVRGALRSSALPIPPVRAVGELPMDARHGSKVARAELQRRLDRGAC